MHQLLLQRNHFSCLSKVKTYLRTTMLNERLFSISILGIEKDRIKNIDLNNIVNTFARTIITEEP